MTYKQALEFIHGTLKFGSVLGLDNIRYLLGLMGNVHKKLKIIHVAGTNGKGSVCAYVTNILKKQGYKVGMYISPYVEQFCERIQINGEYISETDLGIYTTKVKGYIDQMLADGMPHPTEFEIITAIALLYYYEQKCDFVVLEVGLGGELDATNVIDTPLVSVITSVSLDHMEYLGDNTRSIAVTKSGIIKENGVVVCYPKQDKDAKEVIVQKCEEVNASFVCHNAEKPEIRKMDIGGTVFDYKNYRNLKVGLLGEHQVYNAITAVTVIETLRDFYGVELESGSIYEGLADTVFHGRFEVIGREPLVIIDGAHNYSGVMSFVGAAREYLHDKEKVFVVGMLKDKEHKKCIKELAQIADRIITVTPDNPRALDSVELAREAKKYNQNVHVAEDKYAALERAKQYAGDGGAVCVCGSLYLIGGLREMSNQSGI